MGSSILLFESYFYLHDETQRPPEDCWERMEHLPDSPLPSGDRGNSVMNPSIRSFILYSVVTTIICCFGIFGNIISLTVLRRKELVGSVYTYLAVLAATDLALSITFFVGGLARGALYYTDWSAYDALIGLPLGGTINSMSVLATVCVTIDRVLYLWNPVQCTRPKFCNPRIAKFLMAVSLVICIILNLPYCFIFEWDDNGHLLTTEFFRSRTYSCYNWFMLILLTIIPGIILILGNCFLIMSLQKARQISKRCCGKRRKDHTNLTVTLISIIILFIVTEIPSNLVSRTRAVNLIFFGGHSPSDSTILEIIRAVCTVLGAVNVTINFLLYYLFCPAFCRALRLTFMKITPRKRENVHVNVIVLNENRKMSNVKAKVLEIARGSIRSSLFKNSIKLDNSYSKENDSGYIQIIKDFKDDDFSSNTGSFEHELSTTTSIRQGY